MSISPSAPGYRSDQFFFLTFNSALAAIVLIAFAQFAARGMVDPLTLPWWLHLHGMAMVAWLALLVTQNWLAFAGRLQLHRKLGRASLWLLPPIFVLGLATGIAGIANHRVPPFWSNGLFLALSLVQVTGFVALVGAALAWRRDTEWHRHLMLGSTIYILKAALDRLLPVPLLGSSLALWEGGVQLALVAILASHDLRILGRVHPATWWIAFAIVTGHAAMAALSRFPPFANLADWIAS